MSKDVFKLLAGKDDVESKAVIGYTENEINKIEALYDIKVKGEFRDFMLQMGRSDGGLIGDDPIVLYRPAWTVRGQILFQINLFNSLQEYGAWDQINKPFSFSRESETQYYYLQTEKNDGLVYHFDENAGSVECTNLTFLEYLLDVRKRYPYKGVVCKGELIVV
ncbi:SMI1/KNR4 family protein [Collimonas sp. NPDC087041]|uniref:SMI1/KNR4 family protein n=1 Tax=Collimonas sp. NPDC087041 TaxID=3363960 RepID=UPI00380311B6